MNRGALDRIGAVGSIAWLGFVSRRLCTTFVKVLDYLPCLRQQLLSEFLTWNCILVHDLCSFLEDPPRVGHEWGFFTRADS